MQSITNEEYEAARKWLLSKINVDGVVSINDVKIPLEWILELVENMRDFEKEPTQVDGKKMNTVENG